MAIEIPKMNNMRSPGTYLDKKSRSFQLPSFFVMNRAVESVSLYKDGAPTSNSWFLGKVCYIGKRTFTPKKSLARTFTARLAPGVT